jgi:intracellular septation protein
MLESPPSKPQEQSSSQVRMVVEYGPIAAFFIVYYMADLISATIAIMIATVVALVLSYAVERRIPMMPLITAGIVGVFGGLTIWLQDETFIKMKPTIIQAIFGTVLIIGLLMKRLFLKKLMGSAWQMTDEGWKILSLRFALFFFASAVLNEIVWRTQSTDFWVNFKVFGLMGLTFAFILTQIPLIQRFTIEDEGKADAL